MIAAIPIPNAPGPQPPAFIGHATQAHKIKHIPKTPRNRFMAPNGRSEIHNDAWQTDAYTWTGPLGRSTVTYSSLLNRDCGSITFDSRGRIVSVCIGLSGPQLYMLDPRNLNTLATFNLPPRQGGPTGNPFQDFTGGGYFYLDNHDRVVAGTTTRHIYVIAETPGPGFRLVHDYDLSQVLNSSEKISSALPDSHGLLWFVAKTDGVVGTLNFHTGKIHSRRLGNGSVGEIENSFATAQEGAVYIATNRKLYRFKADKQGRPKIVWQVRYPNSGKHKPGQVDDGTGTTPTVMPGGFVNITDNADPMDVVVYTTAHGKQVCRVPVFKRGASADENSVIVAGRSMIVENNFGYTDPSSIAAGKTTAPGIERIDMNRNGRGCHPVWTNTAVHVPTAVTKLSIGNGLIYTYTLDSTLTQQSWYWTALDFRTGRVRWRRLAGTGYLYNNNYAGVSLSRAGRLYLGTLGGVVAMRDS